ncbi:MAG: glycosyltransferase family 10 [Sedimentisphaerales bacterium]
MKFALCTDVTAFGGNKIFDPLCAARYPGAESMSEFSKLLQSTGRQIVTSDIALSHIRANNWQPKEISIIMNAENPDGFELLNLGCRPKILQCFESPIFAWPFYDKLQQLAPKFEHRILFRGAFEKFQTDYGQNHPVRFPIFHRNTKFIVKPWKERKNIVLVAANKHWKKSDFPLSFKPGKYLKWWRKLNSPTLKDAIHNELQGKRLQIIEFFAAQNKIDIFGREWQNLSKLPSQWQKRLDSVIRRLNPQPCEDKIETMSNYKFAVCFENVAYPGYVTEKIIDCLVAGVIPLYLGAPDITDFVPCDTFVSVKKFDNLEKLNEYMEHLDEETAMRMINAGRNFLMSPAGQKHSFEGFAEFLFELLKKG